MTLHLRYLAVIAATTLLFSLVLVALAVTPAHALGADETSSTIQFSFSWLTVVQFVIQAVLPLLVAVVTTRVQSGRFRGVLLAALTVAATLLTSVAQGLLGIPVDLFSVLASALFGFVISVGFHFGLWGAKGPENPVTGDPAPSISSALIDTVGRQSS